MLPEPNPNSSMPLAAGQASKERDRSASSVDSAAGAVRSAQAEKRSAVRLLSPACRVGGRRQGSLSEQL